MQDGLLALEVNRYWASSKKPVSVLRDRQQGKHEREGQTYKL